MGLRALGTQEDQFTGTAGFKQKQAVNISQAPLIPLPNIPHTIIAFMIDFNIPSMLNLHLESTTSPLR